MARKPRITEAEWLEELRRAASHDDEGLSLAEWADRMGCSHPTARLRLKRAHAEGRIVTGFRTQRAMDGKEYRCPVYRWVEKE